MTKFKFNIIGKETPKFHLCMIFFFWSDFKLNVQNHFLYCRHCV